MMDAATREIQEPIHDYFRSRVDSDQQLNDDVAFACNCGYEYACLIADLFDRPVQRHCLPDLTGLSILELGPGINFGPMLICAAAGASDVTVADKYLVRWNATYHPRFYERFLAAAAMRYPQHDWQRFGDITTGVDVLRTHILEMPLDPWTDPLNETPRTFDAIVSNAVLEHVEDMAAMASRLYEITNDNGVGIHQVDFRDHSNPDRPLEFLRTSTEQYARIFREALGGGGNRVRPNEMAEMFTSAGFDTLKFHAGTFADADYVRNIRPHLISRFASMTVEQLQIVGGRFFTRKPRLQSISPSDTCSEAPFASNYQGSNRISSRASAATTPRSQVRDPFTIVGYGRSGTNRLGRFLNSVNRDIVFNAGEVQHLIEDMVGVILRPQRYAGSSITPNLESLVPLMRELHRYLNPQSVPIWGWHTLLEVAESRYLEGHFSQCSLDQTCSPPRGSSRIRVLYVARRTTPDPDRLRHHVENSNAGITRLQRYHHKVRGSQTRPRSSISSVTSVS